MKYNEHDYRSPFLLLWQEVLDAGLEMFLKSVMYFLIFFHTLWRALRVQVFLDNRINTLEKMTHLAILYWAIVEIKLQITLKNVKNALKVFYWNKNLWNSLSHSPLHLRTITRSGLIILQHNNSLLHARIHCSILYRCIIVNFKLLL